MKQAGPRPVRKRARLFRTRGPYSDPGSRSSAARVQTYTGRSSGVPCCRHGQEPFDNHALTLPCADNSPEMPHKDYPSATKAPTQKVTLQLAQWQPNTRRLLPAKRPTSAVDPDFNTKPKKCPAAPKRSRRPLCVPFCSLLRAAAGHHERLPRDVPSQEKALGTVGQLCTRRSPSTSFATGMTAVLIAKVAA